MSTKKEAAPSNEAAPSKSSGVDSPSLAESLGELERALIGHAFHAGTTEHLPPPNVFHAGPRRYLAEVAHSLAGAGRPVDFLTARLRLTRDPNIKGRAAHDELVACSVAGTLTVAPQADYYKGELEGTARRYEASQCLSRAAQLLEGGPDHEADARSELAAALVILGGEAQ